MKLWRKKRSRLWLVPIVVAVPFVAIGAALVFANWLTAPKADPLKEFEEKEGPA